MKVKHDKLAWSRFALVLAAAVFLQAQGSISVVRANDKGNPFERGRAAEARLDLFGARELFREAIRSSPEMSGWKEHTAWFLYINGFQNRECLALFEEVLPNVADLPASKRAVSHLEELLGQTPPEPRAPTPRPDSRPPSSDLTARLKYARELFWSGSPHDAKEELDGLIELKPEEPALRWELSKVLVALGENDAAVEQLEIARQHRPEEPELVVDHAMAEALRGRRRAALQILKDREFSDPAPAHMARGRAHHYSGEFVPAAREYERFLETRPYDELASYELAECLVRNNDIAGARRLLDAWPTMSRDNDWTDRIALEREASATRFRVGGAFLRNSLDYERFDTGFDFRFRPKDELEVDFALFHGWFEQDGFSSIDRRSARLAMNWQPDSYWGVLGKIGVNDYSNGWTSLVGGMGLMVRPASTLEFSAGAERLDVADSESPFGMTIYNLGTTIGAAGGRATMDALSFVGKWTPLEDVDLFGKYRVAELTDNNHFHDFYGSVAYTFKREPSLRFGYGLSYMDVDEPSPLYTEGINSTSYYFDPENLVIHHLFLEHARNITDKLRFGAEARLLLDHSGGTGAALLNYLQYKWNDHEAIRVEARYFTDDGGLDRFNSTAGSFDAFNIFGSYEYRF